MSNAFSEFVALLDAIERIPVAAGAARLSPEERAVVLARILPFVRDRILPQYDLEHERLEAVLEGGLEEALGARGQARPGKRDREVLAQTIDELAHVDARDRAHVERLWYQLYAAIVAYFNEIGPVPAPVPGDEVASLTPSGWFG